jgi:flagellar hook-associated protein 1 FlgK
MYSALQQLAQYGNISTLKEQDGTISVTIGQSALVYGSQAMPLQWVSGSGNMMLEDSQGNDLSSTLTSGSLSELLNQETQVIPNTESNLNQLAQTFATAVNNTLSTGVDTTNSPPTQNLFNFDPVAGVAGTLSVNALQPGDLALADPTAPGGNAIAVAVANLQQATLISGQTLTNYYGDQASQVGQMLSNAQSDESTAQSLTAQAVSMRSDAQSVSLDEEAVNLLQYQRSYDATSQFVKVIDQLTQDVIGMVQ